MSQDLDYQIDEFGMMRHYSQKLKVDVPIPPVPFEPRDVQDSLSVPEVCYDYLFNSEKKVHVETMVI